MTESETTDQTQSGVQEITPPEELLKQTFAGLREGETEALAEQLAVLHPDEVAGILESMPPAERRVVWALVTPERQGEVLSWLHEEARSGIIDEMDTADLVAAASTMEAEDLAEVIEELPEDLTDTILRTLDEDHRTRLETALSFPDGSAGRLMSTDVISVRADVTLAVVLRYLRRHETLPSNTDNLMVTDDQGVFLGVLHLSDVVTGAPENKVLDIMDEAADWVNAETDEHDLAALFERRDLISVAVLADDHTLLGRITVDDVLDIIREEADRAFMKRAGLDEEEDLFAPVLPSARRRAVWLGINLATVFLAAWVIGWYEETLDQIVALAVLMPVVASMGGIAGSQALTLTIRGQSLGQITASNMMWLVAKELKVGALNGLVWALVVGSVTYLWFQQPGLSLVIVAATIINLLAAALSGVVVPVALRKVGVDPALSGAVVLTTVTDVVGFMSFLGLATWLLV
ncbi:MAG: magnesium transporter [Leptospirillia bacterium]